MKALPTVLLTLVLVAIFSACRSGEPDHAPVDIDVFLSGFTEEELDCIKRTIAPERLPEVVEAFIDISERGERATTPDERASVAFYECTPDEFAVHRIISRARLAALPITPAPFEIDQSSFPDGEDSFDEAYGQMPQQIGNLVKQKDRSMSMVYASDQALTRPEIAVQVWPDTESDPDFKDWTAADRILGQVTLYTRYAQLMEPGTDGDLVWVSMTLDVEETLHRFIWGEADGSTWYLVEGDSMERVSAVVKAFAKTAR